MTNHRWKKVNANIRASVRIVELRGAGSDRGAPLDRFLDVEGAVMWESGDEFLVSRCPGVDPTKRYLMVYRSEKSPSSAPGRCVVLASKGCSGNSVTFGKIES